jgi:hypothetical protein
MRLAWRWFTGLGFDQEIPHHSTFSKNRHGRFQESKLFEELFERIVKQCVEVGLVQGQHLSVDGSFVEANAAKESRIPREQLAEAAQVHHTVPKRHVHPAPLERGCTAHNSASLLRQNTKWRVTFTCSRCDDHLHFARSCPRRNSGGEVVVGSCRKRSRNAVKSDRRS